MMKLAIGKCSFCKKRRLVDRSGPVVVCFACKHLVKKGKKPQTSISTKK